MVNNSSSGRRDLRQPASAAFPGGSERSNCKKALRFHRVAGNLVTYHVRLPRVGVGRALRMLVDFELIERARSGDNSAFNGIVAAYRKRIFGTIARLIGRPEDVEDVAQDVFLRLYFSLDQLRTPEVF